MNYLTDLTKEEIKYICTVIPYQETVTYFRKYPKEFAKLRPGFRVKALSEEMVKRTLYEFRTKDFIASYLIKHIDRWIKEIDEEIEKAKKRGLNRDASYINVLSRSYFVKNIALFFKIKDQEKSEDYLEILSSAVTYEAEIRQKDEDERDSIKEEMRELTESQKRLEQQIVEEQKKSENLKIREKKLKEELEENLKALQEEQIQSRKIAEKAEKLESELKKAHEDEVWKSSEMQQKIDNLSSKVEEQVGQMERYISSISELESKLSFANEDIQTWKNQVRTREKQVFTLKAERATLLANRDADKKQIKDLKEALEQALSIERKTETVSKKYCGIERHIPMCPEDMEDFDEYFSDNLENIGFDKNEEGAIDFLNYIEKVFFQGVPVLIKRGLGINLANSLANTLYGVPTAANILYTKDSNIQKVEEFLENTPDRVVCLDGFVGNCNLIELIPVLEHHRNKIIILTYMFDRTLTFVPNEILSYVYFISADVFSALLRIKDITEVPSEIKEKTFNNKRDVKSDIRLQKIYRDVACECGVEEATASVMADMIEDENQLNEMLMFTLLPYVSKVFGKNPYNCSKRLQRYAGETGRCSKKDIMMRWFG